MVSFHACRQAMVVFLQQKYWKPTYSRDVQCLRDVYSTQESSFSFHPIVERISGYLQYIAYIGSDWFSGLYENAAPHFSGSAVFVQMCYKDIKGFLFLFILCLLPSYSSGIMLRHGLILRVVNSITAGGLPPWFFFQSLFFLGGGWRRGLSFRILVILLQDPTWWQNVYLAVPSNRSFLCRVVLIVELIYSFVNIIDGYSNVAFQ